MTSRLKRKLNDLGVDTASSKANENFCLIGTPLPPLEKSKDKGEFVPLWKQEVRDEKGRRRLHGAFTGGFSAGYFNTVGSKEGWAPATFVSSRSDRAKQKAVRPEDFMDEEDLAELAESRKLVDETDEMDLGSTEAEMRARKGDAVEDEGDDSISAALASALEPSPQDSAGARILKKMGWRMGQGIGPRLTYQQRREQDISLGFAAMELGDEEAQKHKYPRRDTPLLIVPRKDNQHGLGYSPGMSLNQSLGVKGGANAKGPKLAAGFGLGALNDADDDDLDVYDGSLNKRGHNRVAFEDDDDGSRMTMGSSRHKAKAGPSRGAVDTQNTYTFQDGRPVLPGFVPMAKPLVEDKWFPLPDIPPGWTPNPRRVWDMDKNKENIDTARQRGQSQSHAEWKKSQLSADQRGTILGETPLPSQPRSVFDYLSDKDRQRIQNFRDAQPASASMPMDDEAPPPPSAPQPEPGPTQIHVPTVHPSVAKAALQGFQPFTSDPIKQSRYTAFLSYASQPHDTPSDRASAGIGPTPGQSIEDFNKELGDYAKAATVFKPLSGAMAGRFTSAVIVESGPKAVEGLHQPDHSSSREDEQDEQEKEKEDPRMGAIRLGMYGPLTREVQPWQPAKLLCKRFGVKEPEMETTETTEESVPTPSETHAQEQAKEMLAITAGATDSLDSGPSSSTSRRDLANIGMGEDETQGRDTLTYVKPSMDVFKAIFASDDEDDDEEPDAPETSAVPTPAPGPSSRPDSAILDVPPPPATSSEATQAEYQPPAVPTAPEKVDMSTFKPTFVRRADRDSRKDKDKSGSSSKDKKKKSSKPALVSFDDDDEGLQVTIGAPKKEREKRRSKDHDGERKKKRRKERENPGEVEDDTMWEEAPPPKVVQTLAASVEDPEVPVFTMDDDSGERPAGPQRGRKRAVDFM
ncbi:hypothetical protein EIP91_008020 [Steccherinum ochraceum]|uniref:G-patch domain-containing protein n=1 Tax=Steccherinum ochraceum TaxID=92696 RepID=A0A4R0R3D7_9APHY|nr:hypothetical protein EIP91_008020 [Steccherinum ochraceum]